MFPPHDGYCCICRKNTTFHADHSWLRDHYLCSECKTIPRNRAIVRVLDVLQPNWRASALHESSPTYSYFAEQVANYSYSQFFTNVPRGSSFNGVRCEDLEHLTFPNESFDIFVTQDVLEHVFHPDRALAEIMRCLRTGGLHIFTTPRHANLSQSRRRATLENGQAAYLLEPVYHGNPIGDGRALVTWDFGMDFEVLAQSWGGYQVSTFVIRDRRFGLDAEFLDVFVQVRDPRNVVR